MKILYVTTISNTVNAFLIPHIKMLIERGNRVDVAFNIEQDVDSEIYRLGCKVYKLPMQRTPLKLGNISAYRMLRNIIVLEKYDLVHTHTPIASTIVRFACRKLRTVKVFYTAHGFHFFKGAPLKNWIIYFTIEWICSLWTNTLITINNEDYDFARRRLKAENVVFVPGVGIDLRKLNERKAEIPNIRNEFAIPENAVILFSAGELNENKNHETVIRAISGLDIYYLIAGIGEKRSHLLEVAKEVGMDSKVKFLGYRRDVPELLQMIDIFVFPSFREGLSISLMEAMACGKPAIVSRIRGNIDLIDENGGLMFNPYSIKECRTAILKAMNSDKDKLGKYNKEKVKKFNLDIVLNVMDRIYLNGFSNGTWRN